MVSHKLTPRIKRTELAFELLHTDHAVDRRNAFLHQ